MDNRHLIAKQRLELRLADREKALDLQGEFSEVYWKRVVPALSRLFDRLVGPEEVVRINKLEIDLDVLSAEELLSDVFIDKLLQTLEALISPQLSGPRPGVYRQSLPLSQFELWIHFLKYGYFPTATTHPVSLQGWHLHIFETLALDTEAVQELSQAAATSRTILERLVIQHNDVFLQRILQLFTGFKHEQFVTALEHITRKVAKSLHAWFDEPLWKHDIEIVLRNEEQALITSIIMELKQTFEFLQSDSSWEGPFKQKLSRNLHSFFPPNTLAQLFLHKTQPHHIKQEVSTIIQSWLKNLPQVIQSDETLRTTFRNWFIDYAKQLSITTVQQSATGTITDLKRESRPGMHAEQRSIEGSAQSSFDEIISQFVKGSAQGNYNKRIDAFSARTAQLIHQQKVRVINQIIDRLLKEVPALRGDKAWPSIFKQWVLTKDKHSVIRSIKQWETQIKNQAWRAALMTTVIERQKLDTTALLTKIFQKADLYPWFPVIASNYDSLKEQIPLLPEPPKPTNTRRNAGSSLEEVQPSSYPYHTKEDAYQDIKGEFYIQNAGVVLLHPFLIRLFNSLGYLKGKEFRDDLSRQKAICLTHYLATGETQCPEFVLVLPKFLCGLPLNMPVDGSIEITEEEQDEANRMLQATVNHWEALGRSSIDGLREGFLQREGKLSKKQTGWLLQVEKNTIDILIDRLPWNLSIIMLPWMDDILKVEWR